MIAVLLRKELRAMRPFLWLVAAMLLGECIFLLLSTSPIEPLGKSLRSLPEQLAVIQLLMGFALGSGLLVREIDEGTLTFLDGLPLTRGAVFLAKYVAAMLLLAIYPLGEIMLQVLAHLAARTSLDHSLHLGLLLTFFGLSMLASAVSLALGLLLGFLRALSWLTLGLGLIGLLLLKQERPRLAAALDPADLMTMRFIGNDWQWPYPTMLTQLAAALVCAALAFTLFKAADGMLARVRKWPWSRRWLLPPAIFLMCAAGLAGMARLASTAASNSQGSDSKDANAVHFAPVAPGHAATTHYTFSYPALGAMRLRQFIKGADQTFADVAALLQIDGGSPIDVDLGGSVNNHAGTAYFDRIRMRVGEGDAHETLAHETTHVFARRVSGGERSMHLDGMVVFNEGLAKWVEGKLFAPQPITEQQQLVAAIVSARRLLAPRQLADFAAMSSVADEDLKYPLGAVLVEQLIRRYGAGAPRTLLKTLARADFPRDLEGYALWQTAFQLSGYDLDLVFDDYARYVKNLEPRFAQQIAALPRLRGSLVRAGDGYAVALRHDLPLPDEGIAMVRFRPGQASASELYHTAYSIPGEGGLLLADAPSWLITRGEVCFQPGWSHHAIIIFEPWVCLPVSSASAGKQ